MDTAEKATPPTIYYHAVKSFFRRKRNPDSHKGQNGTCLVIGGSEELAGAPAMAAMACLACLRTGIDLVHAAAPEKAGWAINALSPDLIVHKFRGKTLKKAHAKKALQLSEKCDACLIGPGMEKGKGQIAFAGAFLGKCKKPVVVDADAIAACVKITFNGPAIVTPHAKEFEALTGKKCGSSLAEKIKAAKSAAASKKCVVLLKGRIDVITDGKRTFLNRTGNAGMTVGGTGDVLAGLCTGFLCLGLKPLEAACAAAFVNGKIGDSLFRKMGYGFIASDFIAEIPKWTKKLAR
ncbi:ADP-dependent (S)-NAD(P)H-hydrate dehydratase [uncultured archaeon]|nr:ADP-dependent (S)-NAD(P)H-hydrate dehydratase [uncultured archaeon]